MKKLEINQMEVIHGSFNIDWGGGFACGLTVIAGGALLYGTGGLGAGIALNIAAAGCGAYIGSQA